MITVVTGALLAFSFSASKPTTVVASSTACAEPAPTVFPQSKNEAALSSVPLPESAWDAQWQRVLAQPPNPDRDAVLAASLKKLGATQPALAAERLCALHPTDRVSVVTASLQMAARSHPDDAVQEAIRFCDEDPSYSFEYGQALISILASTGHHSAALRFVLAEEFEGWLGENGNKWLTSLFTTWASVSPPQAIKAVELLVGPGLRAEALQAIAAGGSRIDPVALANFASQLSDSLERELVLAATLRTWTARDPAAAERWMAAQTADRNPRLARPADRAR